MTSMTTTYAAKRQPQGTPVGGQFASQDRSEAGIGLNWPEAPTADQVSRARDEAQRRALIFSGPNHGRKLEEIVNKIASDIAEQEASLNAWRRGETHPDDVVFADIWDGRKPGMSREQVEIRLSELDEQERLVPTADKATLRKMSSFTDDRQEIVALIGMERRHLMEALRCEGRNLSINQAVILREKQESVPF